MTIFINCDLQAMYTKFSPLDLRKRVVGHLQDQDHSYAQKTPAIPNYSLFQGLMTPRYDNLVTDQVIAAAAVVVGVKIIV